MTIIRFSPLIDNSAILHHMVMYLLPPGSSAPSFTPTAPCVMPQSARGSYGYAPGGTDLIMPEVAGFTVGGSGVQYGIIQFHYNNPISKIGQRDSSGIRMYLQTNPRQYEAGTYIMGPNIGSIVVPPGQSNWHIQTSCTFSTLTTPITVFAYGPHMHLIGKSLWNDVYQTGFLYRLVDQPSWDFNAQRIYIPNPTDTLSNGMTLNIHCVWDSSSLNTTTVGGESSYNEMCLTNIFYYPYQPSLQYCWGTPSAGCSCSYGEDCNTKTGCQEAFVDCFDYKNCSSCSADLNCVWCSAPNLVSVCLTNTTASKNSCASVSGITSCSQDLNAKCGNHTTCAACSSDISNGCHWCNIDNGAGSLCFGNSTVSQNACVSTTFSGIWVSSCPPGQ